MPNWKKLIVSGSDASLNSLTVLNGITGSLFGTASTSSFVTASNVFGPHGSNSVISASYAQTASYSQNLVVSGSISTVDYIDFNTTVNPTHLEGRIHWDDTTKTIQIDTDITNFSIDAGHQSVVRVYNDTGIDINSGSVVYINGAQGNTPTVATASWEIDPSSAGTIGLAATLIPGSGGNRHGYVITSGLITNINTNGFAVGDRLFLSSSGQFTNVAPDAPLHEVRLGVVVVNNATTGVIFVNVVNGFELTELHDVRTTTETYGDLLMYSSSLWINTKQLTGSYELTGSLNVLGNITASLFGTASWANNAISSSFSSTASLAPNYVLNSTTSSMLQPYVLTSVTSSMTVASSSYATRSPYALTFSHGTFASPADATTYYIGEYFNGDPSSAQNASRQLIAPASGWIVSIRAIIGVAGTIATSEDSTLLIRNVTTATSVTLTTTLEHNTSIQTTTYTLGTPLQITEGDTLEMRWTTPTWSTNPTNVRHIFTAQVD